MLTLMLNIEERPTSQWLSAVCEPCDTPSQVTYCDRHVQPPSLQNAESADGQHGRSLGLPSILSKLRSITFAFPLAGT